MARDQASDESKYPYGWWLGKIRSRSATLKEKFWSPGEDIHKKFLDKREKTDSDSRYNLFWVNTGIVKAALYAKKPKPLVKRQWNHPDDAPGRVAALIYQRCLEYDLTTDRDQLHHNVMASVIDYLVPGGGFVWCRYEPTIVDAETEPVNTPDGMELVPAQKYQQITDERIVVDYVNWKDFYWSPARRWEEVWWIAKGIWMPLGEARTRFPKKFDAYVSELATRRDQDGLPKDFTSDKVRIYEVLCKKTKKTYWVCDDVDSMLDEKDYTLRLKHFWPAPKPLLSNLTNEDLMPMADYRLQQDKYRQLDNLDRRVHLLENALRVAGIYDKTNSEVKQILSSQNTENVMIPAEKFQYLAEKGGLHSTVDWFPIEMIANVLEKLVAQKQQKVNEIYELTGIADIMRGASNPRETLGSQELKAQYGSMRIQDRQEDVSNFVKEILNIKAEIISQQFQDETIKKQSQIELGEDPKLVAEALALIRNPRENPYRVEISEASLAMPDYNQERDSRVEFLTAVGQFFSQSAPLVQMAPQCAPMLGQMVRWAAAGFKGATEMEGMLDQMIKMMQEASQKPQEPPPDPSLQIAQIMEDAKKQVAQMDNDTKLKVAQMEGQTKKELEVLKEVFSENSLKMDGLFQQIIEEMRQQGETVKQGQVQQLEREKMVMQMQQGQEQRDHEKEMGANQPPAA